MSNNSNRKKTIKGLTVAAASILLAAGIALALQPGAPGADPQPDALAPASPPMGQGLLSSVASTVTSSMPSARKSSAAPASKASSPSEENATEGQPLQGDDGHDGYTVALSEPEPETRQAAEPPQPAHEHNWAPVYGDVLVGESPVYERHEMVVVSDGSTFSTSTEAVDYIESRGRGANLAYRVETHSVQVGTEPVYETQITGYQCTSCGETRGL